jgi:hypothetical protein
MASKLFLGPIQSAFLYCGRFTDYENTFETIDELDFTVDLATATDVGVLLSKDWFEWADEAHPLLAGARLIFHLCSAVYSSIRCHKNLSCCCWLRFQWLRGYLDTTRVQLQAQGVSQRSGNIQTSHQFVRRLHVSHKLLTQRVRGKTVFNVIVLSLKEY